MQRKKSFLLFGILFSTHSMEEAWQYSQWVAIIYQDRKEVT